MRTDAQRRADNKYKKNHSVVKTIRFYDSEKKLLDHAMKEGSFAGYVKKLIRKDMGEIGKGE